MAKKEEIFDRITQEEWQNVFDKEVAERIADLQDYLDKKGYDSMMIIGERLVEGRQPSEKGLGGFSAIVQKSKFPVLPAILFGVCSRSKEHQDFVSEFLTMVFKMGKKIHSAMKSSTDEKKNYTN